MAQTFFGTALLDDRETEIEFEIAVNSWGCDAQTYGSPENCFPAEPMEVELIDAWLLEEANLPDAPDAINDIADQDKIDTIAEAFRALGDRLCRLCDAAEEAEDRRHMISVGGHRDGGSAS